MKEERQRLQLSQWSEKTADIVYRLSADETAKYPLPDADELTDLSSPEDVPLTEAIYVEQMHRMLFLEELTRMQLVSRYLHERFCSYTTFVPRPNNGFSVSPLIS